MSASHSVTVRFSPSLVSQVRDLRRPTTVTFWPFRPCSASVSAASPQMEHRSHSVSPASSHLFVSLLNRRGVSPTLMVQTALPEAIEPEFGVLSGGCR